MRLPVNEHLALSFEIEVRGLEALLTDCEIATLAVQIFCLDIFQQFSVQIGLLLLKKDGFIYIVKCNTDYSNIGINSLCYGPCYT